MSTGSGINKIIALNGSARAGKGMTDIILKRFLAGAESAGAQAEVLYPAKMDIKDCTACLRCWFQTPGVCKHKDDMPGLMMKLGGGDLGVIASPVYVDGMPAQLKRVFDRFVAYTPPFFEYMGERSYHPKEDEKHGKIVVISTCGFPEKRHFDPIALHLQRICENMRSELVGEFFFPASSLIASDPEMVEGNLQAMELAGREVAESGGISASTIEHANTDYVRDPEAIGKHINEVFRAVREHHGVE
jgi:multimeric flavodoxin WrbA